MAAVDQAAAAAGQPAPRHGLRILLIWLPLALAADLVIWFVWGPHLPPGGLSSSAAGQQFDIRVMAVMAAPVMLLIWIYFGYALTVWRHKEGDAEDGPGYLPGAARIQVAWIAVTTVIVLGLFGFGTYELIAPAGAGSGEGASPIWKPGGGDLQVQVIAQQWRFTYRYPQFGGFETTDLVLPVGQWVQFNVTSLDVIHSFWAYQLGVKADANPNINNVAYTKPLHTGEVVVRCAELCGLWHGAMYDYGAVVSVANFRSWARSSEVQLAKVTKVLPPYSLTYTPNEIKGLASFFYTAGLPGAGAAYYGPQYPNQP